MGELVDALQALISDRDVSDAELLRRLPGPDFPTHQSWGAAASFGGKLYAISGAHGTGASTGIIFDPR